MQQLIQVALVVEHQPQVDFGLRLEVLVDGAFADAHRIGNHLDRDAILSLVEKELQRGIEDFLFAATKFADLTGFILHRRLLR